MGTKKYQIIVADPPWPESKHIGKKLGLYNITKLTRSHYRLMNINEIKQLPVQKIVSSKGCILFLWTPFRHIPIAFDVINSWGFEYKTIGFVWVKVTKSKPYRFIYGPGFYTGSNAEPCFIATCGKVPIPQNPNFRKSIVMECRGRHSEKPIEVMKRISGMYPSLSKIELFARRKMKGWDVMGDAINGMNIQDSLNIL